ncbi:DUF7927 domain-containing protein [Arthrobacter sp. R4-81]
MARKTLSFTVAFALLAALIMGTLPAAWAAPGSIHEITANWAGDPAPTDAPFASTRVAEFHVNTNDADAPQLNEPVDNVRATLTAGNGVFTSMPAVCKKTDVDPVSSISADGTTLVCNIGTIVEGTSTVIQAPIRVSGENGGNLTASGTATSDEAIAPAGPASPAPLPITYSHGMDLSLVSAPGQGYQGGIQESRSGGNRTFIKMNYSLILDAGSRPGPASYTFPVNVTGSVAGAMTGFQFENCVPVGARSRSTGQPYSDPAQTDRTNFPTCAVTGSGANYSVTVSDLTYTLVNTPVNDSMGSPLPGSGAYIASGTIEFSIPTPVTVLTTYTFSAAGSPAFTFTDGVTSPDPQTNNVSSATLPPPGGFSNHWIGTPTYSRTPWDANLWVSPGTSQDMPLPIPGMDTYDELVAASNAGEDVDLRMYMQANSTVWESYTGPGGAQMAGICTMNQNPAFIPTHVDGGGWDGLIGGVNSYINYPTARYFYTTAAINPKTETCGQTAPSGMWTEISPAAGTSLTDPRVTTDSLMTLPAGVTGVKMTWDPAVDRSPHTFLRAFGYISPDAPTSGEGWTVGAFNHPTPGAYPEYPSLNGWHNVSSAPGGIDLPGSTFGPNMNGSGDAFRLQGPQGVITKATTETTAQPGVPIPYTITARADNLVTSPPPVSFPVVDTLPEGMVYVQGSASPAPSSVSLDGRTITWDFTNVPANVDQTISYQAQVPEDGTPVPGSKLTNTAVISVPGDQRPVGARSASATVTVPNSSATTLGKSAADNVLSFYGDTSSWELIVNSQDPVVNPFTDTIDILPVAGDAGGTNIDGTYTITGVDAPAGSTVYYTTWPSGDLSNDPRDGSNGDAPGSVTGNSVNWSTTAVPNPTAVRIIGPALEPGASQRISINFATPAGTDCVAPAAGDNKPGQVLVNTANSIAGHTMLPMLSSATAVIGDCYAMDLKKYVLVKGGDPANDADWRDANATADYPQYLVGDTVPFRIIATNKGSGELTNVLVSDSLIPDCGTTIPSIAVGASATVNCAMTAAVGTTINTATASVTPPDGPPLEPTDPAGFLVPEPYTVVKTADPSSGTNVKPGDVIRYTVTITEPATSAAPYPNPSISDSLAGVLDDADYNGDVTVVEPDSGTATVTGDTLSWSAGQIMPGQTITLTYSVTVTGPLDGGDGELLNVVTPGTGGECVPAEGQTTACTTTHLKGGFTVSKTSDPANGSSVAEGNKITYTVQVRQAGPATVPGALATDNLSKVLDDAAYNNDATASAGNVTVDQASNKLTWTGDLAVGDVVTITYSVTTGTFGAGDGTLTNVVTPGPGGECVPAEDENPDCTTTHLQGGYTVSKTSDPDNGSNVVEGNKVTYTVQVRQTGPGSVTAAVATDDLAKVLDDAAYNNDATASAGSVNVDRSSDKLTWNGNLSVGDVVTITYSVTTGAVGSGDGTLTNIVTPGIGGVCVPAQDQNPDCTTTHKVTTQAAALANTGTNILTGLGAALVLLIAGLVMVSVRRRRAGQTIATQTTEGALP